MDAGRIRPSVLSAASAAAPIELGAMANGRTDAPPVASQDREGHDPSEPDFKVSGTDSVATGHGQRTTDNDAIIPPINGDGDSDAGDAGTAEYRTPSKDATPRRRIRGTRDDERDSSSVVLLRIAARARYFPGDDDRFYGQFAVGDHEETHELRSASFRRWLIREYRKETRGFAPAEALNSLIASLEADAEDAGPLQNVQLRVGGDLKGTVIDLDLGDPTRRTVAISADGWEIVDHSCATFRRPRGMRRSPFLGPVVRSTS